MRMERTLLLGKGVEGICKIWASAYYIGSIDGGRERRNCCMSRLLLVIGPSLSCHLSPSLNSWTQYIAHY